MSLLYIKSVSNEDLLYSTGNSSKYSLMNYVGKVKLKKNGYMYMYSAVPSLVVSTCLHPDGLWHAMLPCPLLSPGVCPNSCPLSRTM